MGGVTHALKSHRVIPPLLDSRGRKAARLRPSAHRNSRVEEPD